MVHFFPALSVFLFALKIQPGYASVVHQIMYLNYYILYLNYYLCLYIYMC